MIQITPQMEIWLAVEAVDFRRSIDGLARVCREVLKAKLPYGRGFSICHLLCVLQDPEGYHIEVQDIVSIHEKELATF